VVARLIPLRVRRLVALSGLHKLF